MNVDMQPGHEHELGQDMDKDFCMKWNYKKIIKTEFSKCRIARYQSEKNNDAGTGPVLD
jgi:hypothetical protein